jgi:hypothetical protein
MVESNQPLIKVTELDHVCYVVHDCKKSAENMWKTFGIGPWKLIEIPIGFTETVTYHGKIARYGVKGAITVNKVGGFSIELIQPTEGQSSYGDVLKEQGEALHHVGNCFVNSLEAFNETVKKMEQAGYPCLMSGRSPDVAFGYFDTTKTLHTILEVLWHGSNPTPPLSIGYVPEQQK